MPCKLKNPLWVNFARIMDEKPLRSLHYFMKDNPLRKSHTYDRTWMNLKSFTRSDTHVRAIALNLSDVQKISTQDASQYCFMHVRRWFYFIKFLSLSFGLSILVFHQLSFWWKSIEVLDLIFELMVNFYCMLHRIVPDFHFSTDLFLFVMFGVEKA